MDMDGALWALWNVVSVLSLLRPWRGCLGGNASQLLPKQVELCILGR